MKQKVFIAVIAAFNILSVLTGCDGREESSGMIAESLQNKIVVTNDLSSGDTLSSVSSADDFPDDTDVSQDKGILYYDLQKDIVSQISEMRSPDEDPESLKSLIAQGSSCMLTPILQCPSDNSVTVQWFTESSGEDSKVMLYDSSDSEEPFREIPADTFKMSRLRGGETKDTCNDPKITADIYKHTAVVDGLPEYHGYVSERVNYRVSSDGETSGMYSLATLPKKGTPLRILLTSDLQIKKMCAANYQKVFETAGHVDAIFCNGDMPDVSDRVYDWFYADNAVWRVFTGTAEHDIDGRTYYGAPLLQEAPVYTSVGNHDVMGVYDEKTDLSVQFNNPSTRKHAEELWEEKVLKDSSGHSEDEKEEFITNHSFNTVTYEEMFELPHEASGTKKYYSGYFGDVALISLDVSRRWNLPEVGIMGKYSELPGAAEKDYGFGDLIFEPVSKGSPQINFFEKELKSESFKDSKYKVVMFHSEAHSLGVNALPAFTDPEEGTVKDPLTGLDMTIYNYPLSKDYIHNVIEPLAEDAGTNLLFNAHSHLWCRFVTDKGMHVLQTSNVGNSYGGYLNDDVRSTIPSALNDSDKRSGIKDAFLISDYPAADDPHGLKPEMPNISALQDDMPYLSSDTITAFSILDTKKGTVDSYYFDTQNPDSDVVLFDSFKIAD